MQSLLIKSTFLRSKASVQRFHRRSPFIRQLQRPRPHGPPSRFSDHPSSHMGQRHSHPSKRLSEFFASSTKTASVDGSTSPSFNFSATTSPTPSFPEGFRWIEGRHFTDDTSPVYPMPNDSDEKARLDSQHYQIRFVFQANQVAPVLDSDAWCYSTGPATTKFFNNRM
ncbi:hypothetical protein BC936DRAFT_136633 [Jimgerdemannia flammicorona]|uniref:Uncharacterized protein n=1 Tax=Jimgerdemannia flammicorona TaxID=994334 RepID=A0A433DJX4_9FUNG|nr:hypothetical protein BC936DRAFT_136633 [Jimgerdemannia flammicorona]